jgi:hypothetical protein
VRVGLKSDASWCPARERVRLHRAVRVGLKSDASAGASPSPGRPDSIEVTWE